MKINGVIPIEKLEGKCATCKHFNPVIKELYGITTLHARGNCSINHTKHGNTYKQRTETCKKWEGIMDKNCCDCEQTYSDDICECELFNKYEEAIKLCKLDYELFPDDNEHLFIAIEALEKQIPKKVGETVGDYENSYYCDRCGQSLRYEHQKYCEDCGGKQSW